MRAVHHLGAPDAATPVRFRAPAGIRLVPPGSGPRWRRGLHRLKATSPLAMGIPARGRPLGQPRSLLLNVVLPRSLRCTMKSGISVGLPGRRIPSTSMTSAMLSEEVEHLAMDGVGVHPGEVFLKGFLRHIRHVIDPERCLQECLPSRRVALPRNYHVCHAPHPRKS